ncbi:MAG: iron-siderophore ABC transporter substrate-binding protein, partial [Actinomycetota bacterium]
MRLTRSRIRRSIVLVLAVVMVACARGPSTAPRASEPPATTGASFPVTITDDDGVAVTLDAPP